MKYLNRHTTADVPHIEHKVITDLTPRSQIWYVWRCLKCQAQVWNIEPRMPRFETVTEEPCGTGSASDMQRLE